MSQTGKVVAFGTLAASAMLVGAMQFASGHDLAADLPTGEALAITSGSVNRVAKSDRAAPIAEATPTTTVSIKLAAFADTSFLLRLPVAATGANKEQGGSPQGSPIITTETERPTAKHPVACEPMVSVLTEIAKRLQPGRCVT